MSWNIISHFGSAHSRIRPIFAEGDGSFFAYRLQRAIRKKPTEELPLSSPFPHFIFPFSQGEAVVKMLISLAPVGYKTQHLKLQ